MGNLALPHSPVPIAFEFLCSTDSDKDDSFDRTLPSIAGSKDNADILMKIDPLKTLVI
jgi:hypothetical protein